MNKYMTTAAASVLALAMGVTSAQAQAQLTGVQALDDRLTDIERDVREDQARAEDRARFGNQQFAPGWTGSLAMSFAANRGNSDARDMSLAGRFNYNIGQWNHSLGLGLELGRANDARTKADGFAVYDANYYIADDFYVFGLGRVEADRMPDNKTTDAFLGFGPGYRIVNTEDVAWRVQAGPGIRYNRSGGENTTEVGAIASSRAYYRITDGVFMTNNTDVLRSKVGTIAENDFGISVGQLEGLSTRFSVRTNYNSANTGKKTDHVLGVSLVYGFR
ncbi:MAG: DUF481 domain-containing protein [Rhodobacteraceae bacterium]|nr:MAG: DUF481 domain-containing protein [Paracoccaceae bacterium]